VGSIPKRGSTALTQFAPGDFLWRSGRFIRDWAACSLAPLVAGSEWRRQRLLILGYHGVSIHDEHLWDGTIYMPAEIFRRRLMILQQTQCAVLPLEVALRKLDDGTLPPRAVALAFDDGFHDFARVAAPILAEFGFPATVFLSSYYAQFNRPVFDIMLRYLLWKGAGKTLTLPDILHRPVHLHAQSQRDVWQRVLAFAFKKSLSGREKDRLLTKIAAALQIDYEALCRSRLLHMMNAEEVRAMQSAGHDIQLHTHRHRVSRRRDLLEREILDNRRWIGQTIGHAPRVHMSYPGDAWISIEREWLSDLGIESATTCRPALVDARCDKLRLPRFMDNSHVPERVFRAWTAGSMGFFPMGKYASADDQIVEDTINVEEAEVGPALPPDCVSKRPL